MKKNMMKKILSMVLALAMCLPLCVPAFAAGDLTSKDIARGAIVELFPQYDPFND